MSLIRCPECNKKISDKANACPKCGYPIDDTLDIIPVRNNHIIRTITLVIVIVCILVFASSLIYLYFSNSTDAIMEASTDEVTENSTDGKTEVCKYPLFKKSSLNITDPYGLSNKNYIIGKDINDVLEGYTEGEDYFVTENEYYCSYTFNREIPYIAETTAKLTLYTSLDNQYINMVEYSFRVSGLTALYKTKIKEALTTYYDVDPTYTYVNDEYEIINTTRDEFDELLKNDYKSLYNINWESEIGSAGLLIANIYEERSNDWVVTFSK